MTRLRLVVSDDAKRELREARDWWRKNRQAAPTALVHDVRDAFELIRMQPGIGVRASNVRRRDVRRLHLGRIRYAVYYRVSDDGMAIEVLAFWHSSRGTGPNI